LLGTGRINSGTAVLPTAFWASGNQSLTAAYSGDTANAASISNGISMDVGSPGSTQSGVTLSAAPGSAAAANNIALTATVTPFAATGQITFYSGTTPLGTAMLRNGTATLVTSLSAAGAQSADSGSYTAQYSGDPNYAAATSGAFTLTAN
jgi:trimeric autotransporter adhesin